MLLLEAKGLQILALAISQEHSQATGRAESDDLKARKHGAHHECGGSACFFVVPARKFHVIFKHMLAQGMSMRFQTSRAISKIAPSTSIRSGFLRNILFLFNMFQVTSDFWISRSIRF